MTDHTTHDKAQLKAYAASNPGHTRAIEADEEAKALTVHTEKAEAKLEVALEEIAGLKIELLAMDHNEQDMVEVMNEARGDKFPPEDDKVDYRWLAHNNERRAEKAENNLDGWRDRALAAEHERNRMYGLFCHDHFEIESGPCVACRAEKAEAALALIGERAVVDWDDVTVGDVDAAVKDPMRYRDWYRLVCTKAARTEKAEAEVERLRDTLRLQVTCAVCGSCLMRNNAVPHCEDCTLTEEHEEVRLDLLAKLEASEQDDQTADTPVAKRQAPIATKPMGDAAEVERLRGLVVEAISAVSDLAIADKRSLAKARTLLAKLEAEAD